MLLAKTKLNLKKLLISEALTDSYINHHQFILVNNVFHEHNGIREEIKKSKNSAEYTIPKKKKK